MRSRLCTEVYVRIQRDVDSVGIRGGINEM